MFLSMTATGRRRLGCHRLAQSCAVRLLGRLTPLRETAAACSKTPICVPLPHLDSQQVLLPQQEWSCRRLGALVSSEKGSGALEA